MTEEPDIITANITMTGGAFFALAKTLKIIRDECPIVLYDKNTLCACVVNASNIWGIEVKFGLSESDYINPEYAYTTAENNRISFYNVETKFLQMIATEVKTAKIVNLVFGITNGKKFLRIAATDTEGIIYNYRMSIISDRSYAPKLSDFTHAIGMCTVHCNIPKQFISKFVSYINNTKCDKVGVESDKIGDKSVFRLVKYSSSNCGNLVSEINIPVQFENFAEIDTYYGGDMMSNAASIIKLYKATAVTIKCMHEVPIVFDISTDYASSVIILIAPRIKVE